MLRSSVDLRIGTRFVTRGRSGDSAGIGIEVVLRVRIRVSQQEENKRREGGEGNGTYTEDCMIRKKEMTGTLDLYNTHERG